MRPLSLIINQYETMMAEFMQFVFSFFPFSLQTLQVFRLPALQREPVSYQYPPAKTVRFECKVNPLFSLVWYKDGQVLEAGKGRVKVSEK